MSCAFRKWLILGLTAVSGMNAGLKVRADNDPSVQKGIAYLQSKAAGQGVGESAMVALALIKAEVPPDNPALVGCITKIRARFKNGSSYEAEKSGGPDIYEAAVVAMALGNLDAESHRQEIQLIAQYLTARQKPNGSWDYLYRTQGDTSISQYAILGLWEAETAGANIPGEVWDRAASWYLSSQSAGGSWNYHRDEAVHPETISMTAAGVGSLLICQRQLARHRRGGDGTNPLLISLTPDGPAGRYTVTTSGAKINQAVRRGIDWLSANFTLAKGSLSIGHSVYYGLYGIERIGGLAEKDVLGKLDWFKQGRAFIVASQGASGSWEYSMMSAEMNTVWAILFLTKSTAKTIRRIEIKRLGGGTLLGGRYLPKDLSSMTIAAGRVVSRPMSGAVEGMLQVLEDPRAAENAEKAAAGLVDRYQIEGPSVLRPHKDRFRKLLGDPDQGVRGLAALSLARTGDLDVVPDLIGALVDPDEIVVNAARQGLQLLSRKIEGLGPAPGATPQQRKEAAQRWREWYNSIRPLDLEGQNDDVVEPTSAAPGSSPQ